MLTATIVINIPQKPVSPIVLSVTRNHASN